MIHDSLIFQYVPLSKICDAQCKKKIYQEIGAASEKEKQLSDKQKTKRQPKNIVVPPMDHIKLESSFQIVSLAPGGTYNIFGHTLLFENVQGKFNDINDAKKDPLIGLFDSVGILKPENKQDDPAFIGTDSLAWADQHIHKVDEKPGWYLGSDMARFSLDPVVYKRTEYAFAKCIMLDWEVSAPLCHIMFLLIVSETKKKRLQDIIDKSKKSGDTFIKCGSKKANEFVGDTVKLFKREESEDDDTDNINLEELERNLSACLTHPWLEAKQKEQKVEVPAFPQEMNQPFYMQYLAGIHSRGAKEIGSTYPYYRQYSRTGKLLVCCHFKYIDLNQDNSDIEGYHFQNKSFRKMLKRAGLEINHVSVMTADLSEFKSGSTVTSSARRQAHYQEDIFAESFTQEFGSTFDIVAMPDCGGLWWKLTQEPESFRDKNQVAKIFESCIRPLVEVTKPGGAIYISKFLPLQGESYKAAGTIKLLSSYIETNIKTLEVLPPLDLDPYGGMYLCLVKKRLH